MGMTTNINVSCQTKNKHKCKIVYRDIWGKYLS